LNSGLDLAIDPICGAPQNNDRTPCHLLLHRALSSDIVGVGRVPHDAMEVERHLPADYGDR